MQLTYPVKLLFSRSCFEYLRPAEEPRHKLTCVYITFVSHSRTRVKDREKYTTPKVSLPGPTDETSRYHGTHHVVRGRLLRCPLPRGRRRQGDAREALLLVLVRRGGFGARGRAAVSP